MNLRKWLFGEHRNCVSTQDYQALKERLMKEVDCQRELTLENHKYRLSFHEVSEQYKKTCKELERFKEELEICQKQEERYKQIVESLELHIKTLQSEVVVLKARESKE